MKRGMSSDGLNHYEVLGLHSSLAGTDRPLAQEDIKAAYRRALLEHHPDKVTKKTDGSDHQITTSTLDTPKNTIDQIIRAYKTLTDPQARVEHDRFLRLRPPVPSGLRRDDYKDGENSYSGLDTVDLDDLDFDEDLNVWFRSCRCGNRRGFVLTETELEDDAEEGIVAVGCRGCSLWLMVLFQPVSPELEKIHPDVAPG